MMVKHKEDEENINEAAKILQEVQVSCVIRHFFQLWKH